MSIVDQKRDLFAKLSAVNALGKLPKPNVNVSFSSINNETNSTDFLIDLTKALVGAEALKEYIVDVLSYRLPEIEKYIKEAIKSELKEFVSCNTNPSIPTWFQNGGSGVEVKLTDIDFFDTMKTDPQSYAGSFIYKDVNSGINSTDFSTYLYNTIQTPNNPTNWGSSVIGSDMLETTFIQDTTTSNVLFPNTNVIKYTTSLAYSNKKLTDFNNDFIDTISIFGLPDFKNVSPPNIPNQSTINSTKVITLIIEELFGVISSYVGKSKKQIQSEQEIKEILDCILNSENDIISDSFFIFDNPTLARIDRETNNRRNGIMEVMTCGNLKVQVGLNVLSDSITDINNTSTKIEEVGAVTNALNTMANTQANFAPNETDKESIRTNFFTEIVKKLQRISMSALITPGFISLFAINHQIIYGQGTTYDGAIDFIKKNRKLIKKIGKLILNVLLELLLNLALSYLMKLLKDKYADDLKEKTNNYVSQLLSLVGVPADVIAQIRQVSAKPIPGVTIEATI